MRCAVRGCKFPAIALVDEGRSHSPTNLCGEHARSGKSIGPPDPEVDRVIAANRAEHARRFGLS